MIYPPEGYIINRTENITALSDTLSLTSAMNSGAILEAKADMCTSDHDLIVNLPLHKSHNAA